MSAKKARNKRWVLGAVLVLSGMLVISTPVSAEEIYDAQAADSTLHGGDRELTSLTFVGSPTVMTGANFLRYDDGYVFNPVQAPNHLYGWGDVQPRDMGTGQHNYYFNPDRADNATPYIDEASSGGTLNEIFGSFNGYKNMNYILDGEKRRATYYVDLYFDGFALSGDDDETTIEVALLERGGNSKMKVYGILAADTSDPDPTIYGDYTPTLTSDSVLIDYNVGTFNPLWTLNTLEIGGDQNVRGYGISISNDWTNLVGLRVASEGNCYEGPDLVGVGVDIAPEPGTLILLALGGLGALLRKRR